MNEVIPANVSGKTIQSALLPLPEPRVPVAIRSGTIDDIPEIDALQKQYGKQLGFMPRKALEGKIAKGEVIVALASEGPAAENTSDPAQNAPLSTTHSLLGYLIGQDRYFKRDDCGIIYQICVAPGTQRQFVGAAMLKAQFERSAYGCKLYCCWCAQDIAANRFWESMGFVPIAFRAGSETKRRVHLFWQKRIREGDATTPWWFPSETKGGSMMADRLVFPLAPGTHWSDAQPIVLPGDTHRDDRADGEVKRIDGRNRRRDVKAEALIESKQEKSAPLGGGLRFGAAPVKETTPTKQAAPRKPKAKNDARFVAAARELRDRYLEHVNIDPTCLLSDGKYALERMVNDGRLIDATPVRLIAA